MKEQKLCRGGAVGPKRTTTASRSGLTVAEWLFAVALFPGRAGAVTAAVAIPVSVAIPIPAAGPRERRRS
jgi:hypothetical protein